MRSAKIMIYTFYVINVTILHLVLSTYMKYKKHINLYLPITSWWQCKWSKRQNYTLSLKKKKNLIKINTRGLKNNGKLSHPYYDMCHFELTAAVTRFLKVSYLSLQLFLQNKVTAFSYYVPTFLSLHFCLF